MLVAGGEIFARQSLFRRETKMVATKIVPQDVRSALSHLEWPSDVTAKIVEQLPRPLYVKTDKVLRACGGEWNRKAKCHTFNTSDGRSLVEQAIESGSYVDPEAYKKAMQWFETPPCLALKVVDALEIESGTCHCLEPSAGEGAIARPLRAAMSPGSFLDCIELDRERAKILHTDGFDVQSIDFMVHTPMQPYDYVAMNPPFTNGQDMQHVMRALTMLRAGGRLSAVTSKAWTFHSSSLANQFRDVVAKYSYRPPEEVPAGTFKVSGTNIATMHVCLERTWPDEQ